MTIFHVTEKKAMNTQISFTMTPHYEMEIINNKSTSKRLITNIQEVYKAQDYQQVLRPEITNVSQIPIITYMRGERLITCRFRAKVMNRDAARKFAQEYEESCLFFISVFSFTHSKITLYKYKFQAYWKINLST